MTWTEQESQADATISAIRHLEGTIAFRERQTAVDTARLVALRAAEPFAQIRWGWRWWLPAGRRQVRAWSQELQRALQAVATIQACRCGR